MTKLRPGSALTHLTQPAFERHRARIAAAIPVAEVRHTGGTSLPAALTRGDLDIHVRVAGPDFPAAAAALGRQYQSYRPEMWADGFATFVGAADADPPVGVALTAIGGQHDVRFVTAWRRLANEPHLLAEYNELKMRHGEPGGEAYEREKSDFFTHHEP